VAPPSGVDPFDRVGSNQDSPAIEIDYARAQMPGPKQRAPAATVTQARRRPPVKSVRSRPRVGYLVLPAIALALLGWMLTGSPEPAPRADDQSAQAAPPVAAVEATDAPQGTSSFAGEHRMARNRRANPKSAPVHMRDVVF
jgi:hypothetical protein